MWRVILRRSLRQIASVICVFSAASATQPVEAAAEQDPLPQIIRDWEQRKTNFGLITYRYSGNRTWSKDSFSDWARSFSHLKLNPNNPPHDVTGIISFNGTLDFQNNRCRIENDEEEYLPASGNLERLRMLIVGTEGVCSTHILFKTGGSKVDFVITRGADQSELILARPHNLPILFASGVVPVKQQRAKEINFAMPLRSEAFVFDGYVEMQGKKLALLRVENYGGNHGNYGVTNRYWVDLQRDSAVVKYASQVGTEITSDIEIEYSKVEGGWLPSGWVRNYWFSGTKTIIETIRVDEIKRFPALADEIFDLRPTASMIVREYEYSRDTKSGELLVMERDFKLHAKDNKIQIASRLQNDQFPQLSGKASARKDTAKLVVRTVIAIGILLPICVCARYLWKRRTSRS